MEHKIGYKVLPAAVGVFSGFATLTGFITHGFLGVPSALLPLLVSNLPGFSFTDPFWLLLGTAAMSFMCWLYALVFVLIYNCFVGMWGSKK
jgi:hypothetical protein